MILGIIIGVPICMCLATMGVNDFGHDKLHQTIPNFIMMLVGSIGWVHWFAIYLDILESPKKYL